MTTFGMKKALKFGTWNVRTMNDSGKLAQISHEMDNYNLSLMGLSEMRWAGCGEFKLGNGDTLIYSCKDQSENRESGVGLLIKKSIRGALLSWTPVSDRIILATFRTRARDLSIVQCYAPTENAEEVIKEAFYQQLTTTMNKIKLGDIKVVMGDLNAKVGVGVNNEAGVGKHGIGQRNENGEMFVDFCSSFDLIIGGTTFPHKEIHKVTWVSPDGRTSNQIDHIAFSRKWRRSFLDVRNRRGADVGSDHHLIVCSVRIKLASRRPAKSFGRKKFDLHKLQRPEILDKLKKDLNERQILEAIEGTNIDTRWSRTTDIILQKSEEIIGLQQHSRKPWISDHTWDVIKERKRAKARLCASNTATLRQDLTHSYNNWNKAVKNSARADKRRWYESMASAAEEAARNNNLKELYQLTKRLSNKGRVTTAHLRDKDGTLLTEDKKVLERWEEYYTDMLSKEQQAVENNDNNNDNMPLLRINTRAPSEGEIKNAIIGLKSGKAAGADNLPADILKVDKDLIAKVLHPIIRHVWETEEVPSHWKDGLIVKIPKKGDLTHCENWRGITLLNTINKILATVIMHRLSDTIEPSLRKEQAGFRPGRSCVDHINTLRIIIEQSLEWRSPLYLLFIDFRRAFDSLNHNAIWKILTQRGVPPKILNIIKNMYTDANSNVLHNGSTSKPIKVRNGVKQGCVLSPLLFNLVLDWIMKKVNDDNRGISWNFQGRLEDLDYADDICLLSHNFADMDTKLQRLATQAGLVGLTINIKKTKSMRMGTTTSNKFQINGEEIEDTRQFCYLGSILSNNGGTEEDIQHRIRKARQCFGMLHRTWSSTTITRRTKVRLFNSNVKSVLLYGCETWKITAEVVSKLQIFVNRCLRKLCRVFWPNTISNEDLWQITGQAPIAKVIMKRKWKWIGHTLRRRHDEISRVALDWNPQGSRKRGRPKMTWRRTVLKEAEAGGKSWNEIKALARNRIRWRGFVAALCSSEEI